MEQFLEEKINNLISLKPKLQYEQYFSEGIIKNYTLQVLIKAFNDNKVLTVPEKKDLDLNAFAIWRGLDWDSKLLNKKIAQLEYVFYRDHINAEKIIEKIIQKTAAENYEYLFCRIYKIEQVLYDTLSQMGFKKIVTNITLNTEPEERNISGDNKCNFNVRPFKNKDIDNIKKIASYAFMYDRFHKEPFFNKNKVNMLYSEWAKNDCISRADEVIVALDGERPVGFISLVIDDESKKNLPLGIGHISLIALSDNYRGKGLGKILVNRALNWFYNKVDIVEVGTQKENKPAVNLYKSCGFIENSENIIMRKLL